MTKQPARRPISTAIAGALALALALALGACGTGATPRPSPSPSPSPAPSVAPVASPSQAASPSASAALVDPSAEVRIDAPYQLLELPPALADQLESSLTGALAGYGGLFSVGARQVAKDGEPAGFLVVMRLPPQLANDPNALTQIIAGVSASTGAGSTPTQRTISGTTVTFFEKQGQRFALYPAGTDLFMVFATGPEELDGVVEALISANG